MHSAHGSKPSALLVLPYLLLALLSLLLVLPSLLGSSMLALPSFSEFSALLSVEPLSETACPALSFSSCWAHPDWKCFWSSFSGFSARVFSQCPR